MRIHAIVWDAATPVPDVLGGYGFGAAERQSWESAGLGVFQAHIPAMCRAFGSRGAGIKPGHLRTKLQSSLTALDLGYRRQER